MEEIIRILMRRDHMSRQEAIEFCQETQEEIYECIESGGSYDDVENIIASNLGLEPDYMIYFLI